MLASPRHALRSLIRTPVFTAAAILTLVLGIGSVAAMFAIVSGVLLEPLAYGHPDRLVSVNLALRTADLRRIEQPPAVFFTYKRFARRIDDIGFYRTGNANIWTGNGGDSPERVTATWVTASTIPVLQVRPMLGRSFSNDEDRLRGPNVVILSDYVWRTRFGAAHDVIGKKLIVNSVPREIVGVMPESFSFPAPVTRLWLPARVDPNTTTAGDFSYWGVARLAAGATPDDAQRELVTVLPRVAELFPRLESGTATAAWLDQTNPKPVVLSLRDDITKGIAHTLWMLAVASGLVLLVAWANVSNLMLIRADGRQLELAVREALGASHLRILTHFLGESLVLTATAGAIALVAAWGSVRALVAFGPTDVPRLAELQIGPMTVACVALRICDVIAPGTGKVPLITSFGRDSGDDGRRADPVLWTSPWPGLRRRLGLRRDSIVDGSGRVCDCVGLDRTGHEHEQANHDEDRGLQADDRSRWHEGQHEQPVDGGPVRSGTVSSRRFLHVRTEPDQGQGQDREVVNDYVRIDER